ncbi:MAG: four helix bundle protein, partial [Gemmatimonadales bacterium]
MQIIDDPRMVAWEARVPEMVRGDVIWRFHTCCVALFLLALAKRDVTTSRVGVRHATADQLLRSVASVGANIAEGYSRASPRERARFYDIALGSVREASTWYASATFLSEPVIAERVLQLSELRRLLLASLREVGRRAFD